MKKFNLLLLACLVITLSGCSVIGGIFKAGAVTMLIAIVVIIAVIIWIISAFRGKGN